MWLISILTVLMFIVSYWKFSEPTSTLIQRQEVIQESPIPSVQEVPPILKEINQRNAAIRTYTSKDVSIKLWERGMKVNLSGRLYYEKPTSFRTIFESRFGTELDLGSNDKIFWYWSTRDKRPGVYYANYEDYQKTRLKTPFNPIFLRQSLGLDELTVNDASKILESEQDLSIVYPRKSSMGDTVFYSVFIDKVQKRVTGLIITSADNKPLASAEIQEYDVNGLPLQILYMWYEEDKAVEFRFEKSEINAPISASQWAMPSYTPQINMANEFVDFPQ
jgi:outer membrane lipoprotein-sorting protein